MVERLLGTEKVTGPIPSISMPKVLRGEKR